MSNPLTVSFDRVGDFAALGADWRDLESRADTTFFLSWDWIGPWLETAGGAPVVARVELDGRLAGLALLHVARVRRHGFMPLRLAVLNETGEKQKDIAYMEYNGALAEKSAEAAVLNAIIAALAKGADAPGFDAIRLGGLPRGLAQAIDPAGLTMRTVTSGPTARVDLAALRAGGGDYLAGLSANARQQIRRSGRLYEARGPVRLEAASSLAEAQAFFAAMRELHQATWVARGMPGAFASPFLEEFHRRVIDQAFAGGRVELLRLAAGEETLGYFYNFLHDGWVGAYMSGIAYEADNKLKPGLTGYALIVERHLARGNRVVDFLAGEDAYKTRLGQPGEAMVWLILEKPLLRFAVSRALRAVRRRLTGQAAS
ncbi:MAG TPA: GNAT family N-acetyltransferase [Afifellaceae bacterium]|nr:GNAT family N-acetyltransferase [Afifellaceae bacterium]